MQRPLFGLAHFIAFVAGVVFFALSFVLLAILPGRRLQQLMDTQAPATMPGYTAEQSLGRAIYAREGCDYCHTEQVRSTGADIARWGPPTAAWETRYDYPQVWGTRRIGPDLAREGGVRSGDWQTAHLFDPRMIVPGSVMPAYPWLFDGVPTRPNASGRAVLSYLETLGQARRIAPLGAVADMEMQDAVLEGGIDANAAIRRLDQPYPDLAPPGGSANGARGKQLFGAYCAGCHGLSGDGRGPASAYLSPRPDDLRGVTYSDRALSDLLWNGRPGTAMPAWRDLSRQELADLIEYIRTIGPQTSPSGAPDNDVVARGATVYATGCIACHGVAGSGDGPAAHVFLPRPANLGVLRPDRERVLDVLAHGVPGAAMPVFSGLSQADRDAVATFVQTLYRPQAMEGR